MRGRELAVCGMILDEWPEDDNFEQVLFKITNWDDAVVIKQDYDEIRRPELVARMRDLTAGFEAAGV